MSAHKGEKKKRTKMRVTDYLHFVGNTLPKI